MRVKFFPCAPHGAVVIPSSKSVAHRAIMAAALAEGESRIGNVAFSQDISATLGAMQQLGARALRTANGVVLTGIARGGTLCFAPLTAPVDCCESGSTLRFLIPVCALTAQPVQFCGKGRLFARPQQVYAQLFAQRGLMFTHTPAGVALHGALTPGVYTIDGSVSSQFITGLLYALPLLNGDSEIHILPPFESRSYVALTLQVLADFGVCVHFDGTLRLRVPGRQKFCAHDYDVEGDFSQAAFFAVLGAIVGDVTVTGLRPDSLQGDKVILDILAQCGARIHAHADGYTFEKSTLHGAVIDLADCPDLGPVLMVLGLFCTGETIIRNAQRLRLKESDRIAAMEQELAKLGGVVCSTEDTVTVRQSVLHSACSLDAHNDHRVVMALSVAALAAGIEAHIAHAEAVQKSYPAFFADLAALGAKVEMEDAEDA